MSYDPDTDALLILASTHHAGRRLAIDADLDPQAYEIVTPKDLHRVVGRQGGFYVLSTGATRNPQGMADLETLALHQGFRAIDHSGVLRAGHLYKMRLEGRV